MGLEQNFDEGLGTVYERFMLNLFFVRAVGEYQLRSVLEVPIRGMTGLAGINSVEFVRRGCSLTIVDSDAALVGEARELWGLLKEPGQIVHHADLSQLPFADDSFDLVWNFAALWHVGVAEALLREMSRVSSKLVLVFIPNRTQLGYLLRKYLIDRDFFKTVDERWLDIGRIRRTLEAAGLAVLEEGVLDVPPWPDTCMPIGQLLEKVGITRRRRPDADKRGGWHWDIMSYYLGEDPSLKERVERFSFIERGGVPKVAKRLWAHHRYLLMSKHHDRESGR